MLGIEALGEHALGEFPSSGVSTGSTVTGADGPPWGLTGKERQHLEEYRRKLAEINEEWARLHRERVDDILNDVRAAAYGPVEEEAPPVEAIREKVKALPQPIAKSSYAFLSADLEKLKAIIAEQEDEEDVEFLLLN